MTKLTLKPKKNGLKRNGGSSKYIVVNKNTWPKFMEKLFLESSWYYLTIIFAEKEYKVNTILWKDEIELLKNTITFPFKYRIYYMSDMNHKACLEIKLDKVPDLAKEAYESMNSGDFSEYYKRALKGY